MAVPEKTDNNLNQTNIPTLSPTYGTEMYYVYEDELIAIADAIRAKTGSTDKIKFLSGFADALKSLKS